MRFLRLFIAVCLLLALAWLSLPGWLPPLAAWLLAPLGWQLQALDLEPPGIATWHVRRLQLSATGEQALRTLSVRELQVDYRPGGLLNGELDRFRAGSVVATLDLAPGPAGSSARVHDLATPQRLARTMPVKDWAIADLQLELQAPARPALMLAGHLAGSRIAIAGALTGRLGDTRIRAELSMRPGASHRLLLHFDDQSSAAFQLQEHQQLDGDVLHSSGKLQADLGLLGRLPLPGPIQLRAGQLTIGWTAALPRQLDAGKPLSAQLWAEGRIETLQALELSRRDDGLQAVADASAGWNWDEGRLDIRAERPVTLQLQSPDGNQIGLTLAPCPAYYLANNQTLAIDSCDGTGAINLASGDQAEVHFTLNLPRLAMEPGLSWSAQLWSRGQLKTVAIPLPGSAEGDSATLAWDAQLDLESEAGILRARPLAPPTLTLDGGAVRGLALQAGFRELLLNLDSTAMRVEGLEVRGEPQLADLLPAGTLPVSVRNGPIQFGFTQLALERNELQAQGHFNVATLNASKDQYRAGPLKLAGDFTLAGQQLAADWQLNADRGNAALLAGHLRHRLDSDAGQLTIAVVHDDLAALATLLSGLLHPWPAALGMSAGRVAASADIAYGPATSGRLQAAVDDGALSWSDYALSGMDLAVEAQPGDAGSAAVPIDFHARALDLGFPVHNLRLQGRVYGEQRLEIDELSAELLGGRVIAKRQTVSLDGDGPPLVLLVEGLDLAELLRLQGQQSLTGNGLVDGNLPLRISRAGVAMEQGALWARAPGGRLQYQADARARAMAENNRGLRIALDALEDFHYAQLQADADYRADGRLLLKLQIEGHNPAVQRGRPVHLNLNVEQNLLKLLQSLRYAEDIGERLRSGMDGVTQ